MTLGTPQYSLEQWSQRFHRTDGSSAHRQRIHSYTYLNMALVVAAPSKRSNEDSDSQQPPTTNTDMLVAVWNNECDTKI